MFPGDLPDNPKDFFAEADRSAAFPACQRTRRTFSGFQKLLPPSPASRRQRHAGPAANPPRPARFQFLIGDRLAVDQTCTLANSVRS